MSGIREQLLAAFEVEHREHIEAIRQALVAARASAAPELRDVFRHAHSLKGAARAVDLFEIENLSHRLEAVFTEVVENRLPLADAGAAVDLALDSIEAYVAASSRGNALPPLAPAHAALAALSPGTAPPDGAKATDAKLAEAKREPVEYLRVRASQVDALSGRVHELARGLQNQRGLASALGKLHAESRALRRDWEGLQPLFRTPQGRETALRAAAVSERLKSLQHGLAAMASAQEQSGWSLIQAARRLREDADQISLVPAETVFSDLGRMVRAIAREHGKTISFTFTGLEVQADRQVLQGLREPLIHVLRNAVSHGGRETSEERARLGKPPALSISVTMSLERGQLLLVIRDDGPGPDLARIESVALSNSLLPSGGRGAASEAHLLSLVFHPGFSTSRAVNTLSGRGVGLSAVAESLRRLRGQVHFARALPWGAEIRITAPLSAARQNLLFVAAGGLIFGLPSARIDSLVRFGPEALTHAQKDATLRIQLAGQDVTIPLVPLSQLLTMPISPSASNGQKANAVVLRQGHRRLAVAVDSFEDVSEAVVASGGILGADPHLILGSVLLDRDEPALILDPDGLFERWTERGAVEADFFAEDESSKSASPSRRVKTILVVDDSITTRTLEKSILEAQGYRVLFGVDGIDALSALRAQDVPVDLVVADVEMPRLDGFGLLQAMKADPRLTNIPVILVTSRDDPENIRRGLELGANAYITKQKFDQRELLDTIGQLL